MSSNKAKDAVIKTKTINKKDEAQIAIDKKIEKIKMIKEELRRR